MQNMQIFPLQNSKAPPTSSKGGLMAIKDEQGEVLQIHQNGLNVLLGIVLDVKSPNM